MMNPLMTAPARRELVEALRQRYAAATRDEKVRILTEFSSVSGLHRKSAIRVLNAEVDLTSPKRRGRPASLRASGPASAGYAVGGVRSRLQQAPQVALARPHRGAGKTRAPGIGSEHPNAAVGVECGDDRSIAGSDACSGVCPPETPSAVAAAAKDAAAHLCRVGRSPHW